MGVSWKLAINYLRSNRKRTFVLSTCIIISTILITTILLLIESYKECQITNIRNMANWEVGYSEITYEEACLIEKHYNVKEISIIRNLENSNIMYLDKNALNNFAKNNLVSGRLPEKNNEVICDEYIGHDIGETIKDGEQNYTVVGLIKGINLPFNNLNEYITLLDRTQLKNTDKVDITILSKNIENIYSDYFDIYYMLPTYRENAESSLDNKVLYNKELLEYANVLDYTSEFQYNIYAVEGIFIGIIIIASVIYIYSVINISIVERKRYWGILNSIGATTKQMKRSIRVEILIILLITVPIGIFLGICIDLLLITIINNILPQYATAYTYIFNIFNTNENINVVIPISTIGMSILIIVITVYVASIIPIEKITKTGTIYLIRGSRKSTRLKKNRKKSSTLLKPNGIEKNLALKNIEQYKSRYSAIIFSLIVCIALIIVSNYYIKSTSDKSYVSDYNYHINISYSPEVDGELSEKVIHDIKKSGLATKIIGNNITKFNLLINKNNISEEEKNFSKKIYNRDDFYAHVNGIYSSNEYNEFIDTYYINIDLITLDDDSYKSYLEQLGINELAENECIFVDWMKEKTKYYDGMRLTTFQEGDEIVLQDMIPGTNNLENLYDTIAKIKIKKITDKFPTERGSVAIIMSDSGLEYVKKRMYGEDYYNDTKYENISLNIKNIEDIEALIAQLRIKYNNNDIVGVAQASQEDIDSAELFKNIFIYSFISVIILIGFLNMYNATNSNIEIRKREAVSLITIGMQQKQITKMIFIENLICGLLALILGITAGISISYIIYYKSIDALIYTFSVPWEGVIISIIGIVLVSIISTLQIKNKIFLNDLVETLKREEV